MPEGFGLWKAFKDIPNLLTSESKPSQVALGLILSFFYLTVEWPLEIFVNRFFGHFERYDYLKTLQVGVEEDTYTSLYIDRLRRVLERFGQL